MSVLPVKPPQGIPFQTKNGRLHLLQWCKSLQGEIALRLVSLIFRIIPIKTGSSIFLCRNSGCRKCSWSAPDELPVWCGPGEVESEVSNTSFPIGDLGPVEKALRRTSILAERSSNCLSCLARSSASSPCTAPIVISTDSARDSNRVAGIHQERLL